MKRQRYSDDAPYGPGNIDYHYDERVQNELEAELDGAEAAKSGNPVAVCPFFGWEHEFNAWHRGYVREKTAQEKLMQTIPTVEPISTTTITNGAYNLALVEAIAECRKLLGEIALGGNFDENDIALVRTVIERIEALRVA